MYFCCFGVILCTLVVSEGGSRPSPRPRMQPILIYTNKIISLITMVTMIKTTICFDLMFECRRRPALIYIYIYICISPPLLSSSTSSSPSSTYNINIELILKRIQKEQTCNQRICPLVYWKTLKRNNLCITYYLLLLTTTYYGLLVFTTAYDYELLVTTSYY